MILKIKNKCVNSVIFKRGLAVLTICIIVSSVYGVQWKTHGSRIEDWRELGLETGDIIFVDLFEGWCHGGFWDHLAIYVGNQPYYGKSVVEATFNDGISITSASSFFSRDEPAKMAVLRLAAGDGNDERIEEAVDYALEQVGKPFDYTAHTTTVPHKINDKKLHCTELVWRSYNAAGIDIDSNSGILVYPDDIFFSSKLKPV